jgi:hypothetical protein
VTHGRSLCGSVCLVLLGDPTQHLAVPCESWKRDIHSNDELTVLMEMVGEASRNNSGRQGIQGWSGQVRLLVLFPDMLCNGSEFLVTWKRKALGSAQLSHSLGCQPVLVTQHLMRGGSEGEGHAKYPCLFASACSHLIKQGQGFPDIIHICD